MKKNELFKYLIAVARIYLALIFLLGGLDKINNLEGFAQSIENYKILPIYTINLVAIILPWLEVITGFLLLTGTFIKENSILILFMLSIFTLSVIIALLKNLDIDCGCMGTADGQKVGLLKITENLILILISIVNIIFPYQRLTLFNK